MGNLGASVHPELNRHQIGLLSKSRGLMEIRSHGEGSGEASKPQSSQAGCTQRDEFRRCCERHVRTIEPGLAAARLSVLQLQPHRSLEGGQFRGLFIQKCRGPCFCIGDVSRRAVQLIKRHGQQRDDTSLVITVITTVPYHLQRITAGCFASTSSWRRSVVWCH